LRKVLVLVIALLISLTLAPAAFANSGRTVTYFNNGNSGWFSSGQQGYYWYGFDFSRMFRNANYLDNGYSRGGDLVRYTVNGKTYYYYYWNDDSYGYHHSR